MFLLSWETWIGATGTQQYYFLNYVGSMKVGKKNGQGTECEHYYNGTFYYDTGNYENNHEIIAEENFRNEEVPENNTTNEKNKYRKKIELVSDSVYQPEKDEHRFEDILHEIQEKQTITVDVSSQTEFVTFSCCKDKVLNYILAAYFVNYDPDFLLAGHMVYMFHDYGASEEYDYIYHIELDKPIYNLN